MCSAMDGPRGTVCGALDGSVVPQMVRGDEY